MSKMRPLIIDAHAKAQAQRVMDYAALNHYRPGETTWVPGDNANFVATFDTYRVVFTFSEMGGRVYRHISISVPSQHYPNPAAVFALADLFGFTGWDQKTIDKPPDGWLVHINEDEHCIAVAQQMLGYGYGGNTN